MATCAVLEEIDFGCERNSGGLFELYLGDMEDISAITEDATTFGVTAMTVGVAPVKIAIKRGTSNYTDVESQDFVNGSSTATLTVNGMLHRRSKEKSKALNVLGAGQRYLYGFLKDANGKWWYGKYIQLQETGEGSGQARADGSKYSFVLLAENDHTMYEIDGAIVATAIAVS